MTPPPPLAPLHQSESRGLGAAPSLYWGRRGRPPSERAPPPQSLSRDGSAHPDWPGGLQRPCWGGVVKSDARSFANFASSFFLDRFRAGPRGKRSGDARPSVNRMHGLVDRFAGP